MTPPTNIVDAMTDRLLSEVGLSEGQHVLDIGCGAGAVTRRIAARVGSTGRTVGLDIDTAMLDRARQSPMDGLSYHQGGFAQAADHGPVDLVLGRRVLMYQADPVADLRALAPAVRPGGLIAFHEHDWSNLPDQPDLPLHMQVRGWLQRMLLSEGARLTMGADLPRVMADAGLEVAGIRAEINVMSPTQAYPLGDMIRATLPRILAANDITAEEVGVDTLDARLDAERQMTDALCLWEMCWLVWARRPDPRH